MQMQTKEDPTMKEKKKDKSIVNDAIGDPAFYNDQIGENAVPAKEITDKKKCSKCKK